MRATVDLRNSRLDELEQRRLQPRMPNVILEAQHRLERVGCNLLVVDPLLHGQPPFSGQRLLATGTQETAQRVKTDQQGQFDPWQLRQQSIEPQRCAFRMSRFTSRWSSAASFLRPPRDHGPSATTRAPSLRAGASCARLSSMLPAWRRLLMEFVVKPASRLRRDNLNIGLDRAQQVLNAAQCSRNLS